MTQFGKPLLTRAMLRMTQGTPEHALWLQKARNLSWLNAFDFKQNTFGHEYDARGNLIRARFRTDPKAGNARYDLLERQARAQGVWPPPADFRVEAMYTKPERPGMVRRIQERWRMRHGQGAVNQTQ